MVVFSVCWKEAWVFLGCEQTNIVLEELVAPSGWSLADGMHGLQVSTFQVEDADVTLEVWPTTLHLLGNVFLVPRLLGKSCSKVKGC